MNLGIENQYFIVGGASSGFGLATARKLMDEGAHVIGIARGVAGLQALAREYGNQFSALCGDITDSATIKLLENEILGKSIHGVLVNAGGPPALAFEETSLNHWDDAYRSLLRWKVEITQMLLPHFRKQQYGRLVYIESSSIKQPIENLVLSTSLRLAVAGMVKTLSQEVAGTGITANIIAPGSHNTPAIERLITKKGQLKNIPMEQAREEWIQNIPVKKLGNPEYLGSLAVWLLSPLSEFVTGQVYALDGGNLKGTL